MLQRSYNGGSGCETPSSGLRDDARLPLRTNAPTGRVDRNWTESGGKAPQPGFLLVGELAQVPHYPEMRASPGGYLHRA